MREARCAADRRRAAAYTFRLHRHWRRRAWRAAAEGRWTEAVALQRALLTTRPAGSRAEIQDRFRLLRWELAAGAWRESLENADLLYVAMAGRGILDGPAVAWIFLARAVAQFQLGLGPGYRRTLASVLKSVRHERARGLRQASIGVAAAIEAVAVDGDLSGQISPGLEPDPKRCGELEPQVNDRVKLEPEVWDRGKLEPEVNDRRRETSREGDGLLEILQRKTREARWSGLPDLIAGPPEFRSWQRRLWRLPGDGSAAGLEDGSAACAAVRGGNGCPNALHPPVSDVPAGELSRSGSAGGLAPGPALCAAWLEATEADPDLPVPVWQAPLLARLIEDEIPEADPDRKRRLHQALRRLAGRMAEPWARALVLQSLAEASLWMAPATGVSGDRESLPTIGEAKADLLLAAGLFRRLGWEDRADECERRWIRLACPALSGRLSVRSQAPEPTPGNFSLAWVRQRLFDAGFISGDRRVLQDLAPLLLLAATPLPVLILGESGTGKEVVARAVHRWSKMQGEFVPIHCGAIPRDLLESELFGHARGAFTGAATDKQGLIEAADGGSLFLDEIGEMGSEAQMKMLRVLESGEVRRLGDLRPRRARMRLVAATHRNLDQAVKAGGFRLDLYHRIRGIIVRLRPLRERRGDIPLLAAHLLSETAAEGGPLQLQDSALARLLAHDWPGNVRELRGVLLRAAHLAKAVGRMVIGPELLGLPANLSVREEGPEILLPAEDLFAGSLPSRETVASRGLETVLEEMERRLILGALEENGWNRTRAARGLGGISRTTLLSKMKRLGIGAAAESPSDEEEA